MGKSHENHPYSGYVLPLPPIKNLVFSGGGVRGLVYPGAVERLDELGVLDKLDNVAGTSAGGIIAMMVALGFSADEIKYDSDNTNFVSFMDNEDHKFWDSMGLNLVSKMIDLLTHGRRGVYKGDAILGWGRMRVFQALGNPDATFADLHEAAIKNPKLKDLWLTGTNLNEKRLQEFNYRDTPNVPIAYAMRATMSFPGAFKPFPIQVNGRWSYFVDGGVVAHFPMSEFDEEEFCHSDYGLNVAGSNPCTLGIRVDTKDSKDSLLWRIQPSDSEESQKPQELSMTEYIKNLLTAMYSNQHEVWKKYSLQTIQIFDNGHGTLDFNVSNEKKDELYKIGYIDTSGYFDLYRDPRCCYELERLGHSRRIEKQLTPLPGEFLQVWTNLTIQLRILQQKHTIEDDILMRALKVRVIDFMNHPLAKADDSLRPDEELVQKHVDQHFREEEAAYERARIFCEEKVQRRHSELLNRDGQLSQVLTRCIGYRGDLNILEMLIKTHPQELYETILNCSDEDNNFLLHIVAKNGHLTVLRRLLFLEYQQSRANLHLPFQENNDKETPLYVAASRGYKDVVIELMRYGAQIDQSGLILERKTAENEIQSYRDSALLSAARHRHYDLVEYLFDHYAGCWSRPFDLNASESNGCNIFHYMTDQQGSLSCDQYFSALRKHYRGGYTVFTSQADEAGNTPLHLIATFGRLEILESAQQSLCYNRFGRGVTIHDVFDLNVKNNNNHTPLDLAVEYGHVEIVERLFLLGASIPDDATIESLKEQAKVNQHKKPKICRAQLVGNRKELVRPHSSSHLHRRKAQPTPLQAKDDMELLTKPKFKA